MNIDDISKYIVDNYMGIKVVHAWGEKSFFYNPEGLLQRGVYFCTLKDKDGDNDRSSNLDRQGFFRLNFAISKASFIKKFGDIPKRPAKGFCIEGVYDFTSANVVTPHPVYGWMTWVSVINPTESLWKEIVILLDESYYRSCNRYEKLAKKL